MRALRARLGPSKLQPLTSSRLRAYVHPQREHELKKQRESGQNKDVPPRRAYPCDSNAKQCKAVQGSEYNLLRWQRNAKRCRGKQLQRQCSGMQNNAIHRPSWIILDACRTDRLENITGPLLSRHGVSWGNVWAVLGGLLSRLGALFGHPRPILAPSGYQRKSWGHIGFIESQLEPSRARALLGAFLGFP